MAQACRKGVQHIWLRCARRRTPPEARRPGRVAENSNPSTDEEHL
ncbi:hypothetical protein SCATT_38330 [Streptantibioticus cattleyicolor NRRL 8057 = DSM 46488]|uniref:Uncharacterized protein n=1 Tax=Streptantibioticus cattleyicolor (strain ATCC 35852 / DSM 46488 / JCM 4925 / NBRC 14057 / NRRL 8057) TaxID=1003195 RepID=G8WR48_STREN|nr:hypothetical protein SCATT_38330 [Streptantibioticus cattleyicolor NRRL 8057 = DSM 46488]